jgi:putative oxidoreductase
VPAPSLATARLASPASAIPSPPPPSGAAVPAPAGRASPAALTPPRRLLGALTRTPHDPVAAFLQITLAVVLAPHGAQKVFGWFGGYGLSGTLGFMSPGLGIPVAIAVLAIAAESLGSLALAAGLLTRVAALGVLAVMVVAALLVHLPNGFFMNWSGAQGGEGFEYHVLAGALALALVIRGGGAWSLDRALSRAG